MSITATIIDSTEVNRQHLPGSDIVTTDIEVNVHGAEDARQARSECEWKVRGEADGEVIGLQHHTTEGPMDDGRFVFRYTTTTLRYF